MKIWKKLTAILLAAFLAGTMAVPALAAEERIKIEDVALSFTAYDDSEEYGEVEVNTGSGPYYVEDVEFLSNTAASKYPRVKVTVVAEEGYYFAVANKSLFTLAGEGAAYSSSNLRNSKGTVVVTVQLKNYSGAQADVPDDVEWDYEGSGSWGEVANAGYYEVRLRRGGTVIGEIMKVDDLQFNFCNMITQTGNYSFQVRTVNRYVSTNKSKWVSSERWTVDADTLLLIRNNAANGVTNNFYSSGATNVSNTASSPAAPTPPANSTAGWQADATGYWYRNYDGTWPKSCWMMIDGYWYFFNESGYRVANQWQLSNGSWYYLGPNGAMLTNTRTPDNLYVDGNGVYIPGV